MQFYNEIGKIALESRLRKLSERLGEDALQLYKWYDVPLLAKWFPVFYVLSQAQALIISAIAAQIGHSQPSVSKIVREMVKKGIAV